ISPYEHHSNYLIWKESFADVVEICLSESGEFDYEDLENKLKFYHDRVKIGSFSAASNITGIKTDVYRVAKLMHQHKGLVFFDFACSAPYVEINMNKDEESYFDALFFSPHKFVGGPGSSGILIINKNIYNNLYPPTIAGGGTVQFVSPYCYSFVSDVEVRENAGTPGILQIIKASLALEVKHLVGVKKIITIEEKMIDKAITTLSKESNFIIYGPKDPKKRISILSFNIKHGSFLLHHRFVSKLLNDLFGIQSRAGCACAGPYAHRLLRIDREKSQALEEALKEYEVLRPGFVRINFHYLMSEEEVDYIIEALKFVSQFGHLFLSQYYVNLKKGFWKHNYLPEYNPIIDTFGIKECLENTVQLNHLSIPKKKVFKEYLDEAHRLANHLMINNKPNYLQFNEPKYEQLRWFNYQYYKEE
ncbi:MAG TPA: aminotransferase class V-fold PLP-dependent enzyme, partial [Haloplasmataceae bacterium]